MVGNVEGEGSLSTPTESARRCDARGGGEDGPGLPSSRGNARYAKPRRALPLQGVRAKSMVVPRSNPSPLRGAEVYFLGG